VASAWWPWLALVAALLGLYGPWLTAATPQMGGDVTIEFYPRLAYAIAALRQGALPLWATVTMAGTPLLANPQLGLLYPVNWPLLLLLPVGAALNYSAVLHVALAAGGMYLLARRWGLGAGGAMVAAFSFAGNGLFAARLWAGGLSLAQAAAWLPVLLLAAERVRERPGWRSGGLLAATLTLSLLVGFYQPWYWGVLLVGSFLVLMPGAPRVRAQRLAVLVAALVLAGLLAAPQLLPAAELIGWTTRVGRLDWQFATAASLPPWHLVTLVAPELFGSGAGTYWPGPWWYWHERTAYPGLLALALVPLGFRSPRPAWVWFCTGTVGVALVLALGRFTPLYWLFYEGVPGYASFRDPARHLLLVSLALAPLAGRGAERLCTGEGYRGVLGVLAAVLLGTAALALALPLGTQALAPAVVPWLAAHGLWSAQAELLAPEAAGAVVVALAARACASATLAAALGFVAVVLSRRLRREAAARLLAAALFVDLALFSMRYLHAPLSVAEGPFGPPAEQFAALLGHETIALLAAEPGLWRLAPLGRESVVAGNAGYLLGIPLAIGLDPLLPRRYAELAALINGSPVASFEHVALYFTDSRSPLWPLLNARYILEPETLSPGEALLRYRLREDPRALPRAFAVGRVVSVADEAAALAALRAPSFDPRTTVVIEAPAPVQGAGAADAAVGTVEVRAYRPGAVRLAAHLATDGVVVLLEAWHPGWRVVVNGQPRALFPADLAFMAVPLPAGDYELEFVYDPGAWRLGLVLAGVGAALCAVLALWGAQQRYRARRAAAPGDRPARMG